jgi:hypothetical protein
MKSRKGKKSGGDFIKVGVGGSTGSTVIPIIIGYLSGFAFDALYNMLGLFGYNEKIANCGAFSKGDLYQLGGFMGLTLLSFIMKNWSITAFAFGVAAGSITPKLAASYGLPRYLLFNIDKNSGSLSPLGGGIRSITGDASGNTNPQNKITQVGGSGSKAMAAINDLSKNVSPLEMKKEMIQDQLNRLKAYEKDPVSMYNMLLDSGGLDFETMNSGPPERAGEFKIHGLALN